MVLGPIVWSLQIGTWHRSAFVVPISYFIILSFFGLEDPSQSLLKVRGNFRKLCVVSDNTFVSSLLLKTGLLLRWYKLVFGVTQLVLFQVSTLRTQNNGGTWWQKEQAGSRPAEWLAAAWNGLAYDALASVCFFCAVSEPEAEHKTQSVWYYWQPNTHVHLNTGHHHL